MSQPHPSDIGGVVDVVRRAGSVHFLLDDVCTDFDTWRRAVRRHARAEQLRVSIRRVAQFVIVENLDYEVSSDDMDALADVIGTRMDGRSVGFDEALHARRRARLRLVTEPDTADGDGAPYVDGPVG